MTDNMPNSEENEDVFCQECDCNVQLPNLCDHFEVVYDHHKTNNEEKTQKQENHENNFEELLISVVQARPSLWDSRLPLEKRAKTTRDDMWIEIHKIFGGQFSIEVLIKKWRNLRDTYIKSKIERETYVPTGSAAKKKKKQWKHYESMKFIGDTVRPRQTTTNLTDTLELSPTPPTSSSGEINVKKGKHKKSDVVGDVLLQALTNMPPHPVPIFNEVQPPINPICTRLSEILSQLPMRKRAELELEFLGKAYRVLNDLADGII